MRNPRVRFQIDVYAIEHDPFAIATDWRADTLQFHHVSNVNGCFVVGDGV